MQIETVRDPTRTRRHIQESSKLPIFGNIFDLKSLTWQLQKWSFTIKMKMGVDSPELKAHGDDGYQRLDCPIRHPSRDTTKKRFLYIKQVVMRTSGITAMPRLILRASICNVEPRIWTTCANKRKACRSAYTIFQTSYGRFRIFSDPCIGHFSWTKK